MKTILAALISLLLCSVAEATDVFIPTGSSADQINTAATALNCGDKLLIQRGGTYTASAGDNTDNIKIESKVCTPLTPITIGTYGTGNRPILDFTANKSTVGPDWTGVWIRGSAWITVQDLAIRNSHILVEIHGSNNITIENNELSDAYTAGMKIARLAAGTLGNDSYAIRVTNNLIHDLGEGGSFGEGIYVGTDTANNGGSQDTSRDILIKGNRIWNTTHEIIEAKPGIYNLTIEDNTLFNFDAGTSGADYIGAILINRSAAADAPGGVPVHGNAVIRNNFIGAISGGNGFGINLRGEGEVYGNTIIDVGGHGIHADDPSPDGYIRNVHDNKIRNWGGSFSCVEGSGSGFQQANNSCATIQLIYVDRDNCPGPGVGSTSNPYCSIQGAMNHVGLTAGARIRIRSSATPYIEQASRNGSPNGTAAEPIIIEPDLGHDPNLYSTVKNSSTAVIHLTNVDYWTVQNLRFDASGVPDTGRWAVEMGGTTRNVTGLSVLNNQFINWGGTSRGTDKVSGTDKTGYAAIHLRGERNDRGSGSGDGPPLFAISGAVISGNTITNPLKTAIRFTSWSGGNNYIENNTITGVRCQLSNSTSYPSTEGIKVGQDGQGALHIRYNKIGAFETESTCRTIIPTPPSTAGYVVGGIYCDVNGNDGIIEGNEIYDLPGYTSTSNYPAAVFIESRCDRWTVKHNVIRNVQVGVRNVTTCWPANTTTLLPDGTTGTASQIVAFSTYEHNSITAGRSGFMLADGKNITVRFNSLNIANTGVAAFETSDAPNIDANCALGFYTIDNNHYYDNGTGSKTGRWMSFTTRNSSYWKTNIDKTAIFGAPGFLSSTDLSLTPTSILIDAGPQTIFGLPEQPIPDQDPRCEGRCDLGAYERLMVAGCVVTGPDNKEIRCQIKNKRWPELSATVFAHGWSFRKGGSNNPIVSVTASADILTASVTNALAQTDVCDVTYNSTIGTLGDSAPFTSKQKFFTLSELPCVPPSQEPVTTAGFILAVGTFTGNATDDRTIDISDTTFPSVADFTPDVVMVRCNSTVDLVWRIAAMGAGNSVRVTGAPVAMLTDGIKSHTANGFVVGTGGANTSGVPCHYLAMANGAGNGLATGSYVGDGTSLRSITISPAFSPGFSFVNAPETFWGTWRTDVMPTDRSCLWNFGSVGVGCTITDRIRSFSDGAIAVGSNNQVNLLGRTYYYMAIKNAATYASTGILSGNTTDNRQVDIGFRPDFYLSRSAVDQSGVCYRFARQTGDATFPYSNAVETTNAIQAFTPNGVQLGTANCVNNNGQNNYWMALRGPTQTVVPAGRVFTQTMFID